MRNLLQCILRFLCKKSKTTASKGEESPVDELREEAIILAKKGKIAESVELLHQAMGTVPLSVVNELFTEAATAFAQFVVPHCLDLEAMILRNERALIDLTDIPERMRERWRKELQQLRCDCGGFQKSLKSTQDCVDRFRPKNERDARRWLDELYQQLKQVSPYDAVHR